MDINLLFKNADMACGRVLRILPQDEIGSPKQYLQDILETKTVPALNELYPYIKRVEFRPDVNDAINTDPIYTAYRIGEKYTNGLGIQSIKACYAGAVGAASETSFGSSAGVSFGRSMRLAAYPNKYGRYSSSHIYETALLAQMSYADNMMLGQLQEAPIARFELPNVLLINKSYGSSPLYTLVLCLNNDKNLLTLPDHIFDGVKRLFILDVKSTIYSQYGMLSSIDTALGTIDLKIEDWSGAESERNDLFDNYKSMAHLRRHSIING